jgi:hypothetical protein
MFQLRSNRIQSLQYKSSKALMTRNRHDAFAKQHLAALLKPYGEVFTSHKITSETREVDLWFIPRVDSGAERRVLGLLGQMLHRPSAFEPFRNAVSIDEIDNCLSKLNFIKEELRREARREKRRFRATDRPQLWILSPTLSADTLQKFAAKPRRGWEQGVYFLPPGQSGGLVATHKLPISPRTLLLRLMARGKVQEQAIAELLALPDSSPFKRQTIEHLARADDELNPSLRTMAAGGSTRGRAARKTERRGACFAAADSAGWRSSRFSDSNDSGTILDCSGRLRRSLIGF